MDCEKTNIWDWREKQQQKWWEPKTQAYFGEQLVFSGIILSCELEPSVCFLFNYWKQLDAQFWYINKTTKITSKEIVLKLSML